MALCRLLQILHLSPPSPASLLARLPCDLGVGCKAHAISDAANPSASLRSLRLWGRKLTKRGLDITAGAGVDLAAAFSSQFHARTSSPCLGALAAY